MEIVEAHTAHLEWLVPLFDAYRAFYNQPSDPAGCREFLRDRITNHDSVIYLALSAGAPAGFTQLYPSFSSTSMRRIWILNDLFVSPAFRRTGAAQALIGRARQLALDTGAARVVLATRIDNTAAQQLYRKLGFVRDAEFYHYALAI